MNNTIDNDGLLVRFEIVAEDNTNKPLTLGTFLYNPDEGYVQISLKGTTNDDGMSLMLITLKHCVEALQAEIDGLGAVVQ